MNEFKPIYGYSEREEPMVRFAGFWIRVLATLIDAIALIAVSYLLFDPLRKIMGIPPHQLFSIVDLLELLFNFAYYVIFTVKTGQTLGKMAMGIRVVPQKGGANTWGSIILRETVGKFVSAIVLMIGYLVVAFDDKKRGWHDRLAETYVIKER